MARSIWSSDVLEDIKSILDEHSGGCKGNELFASLLMRRAEHRNSRFLTVEEFEECLETLGKEHGNDFGVLMYGMTMGEHLQRVKYFVYRKLK